jgi:hypothetical protein
VVAPTVHNRLRRALATQPTPGSSPSGLCQVLADLRTGPTTPLTALLLSDFVEDTSTVSLNRPLSERQARRLADSLTVPDLSGARIRIAGAGVTAAAVPPPDDWLHAVRSFAHTICRRAHATKCTVTTQTR